MLIENQKDLDKHILLLAQDKYIAVDTEFIRDKCYYPKLALIQIMGSNTIFAVDVLKSLDLTKLVNILQNRKIVKVFHASRQDLEVIYYHFNISVRTIFDTQIAALFLGFNEAPSYEKLVKHYLNQNINKAMQYSNWLKRPLDQKQLEYALLDVELLYQIYPIISKELQIQSKLEWASEEFKPLEKIVDFLITEEGLLKKIVHYIDNKEELFWLLKLIRLREETAKSINLTRNYVASDEALIKAVKTRKLSSWLLQKLKSQLNVFENTNTVLKDQLLINKVFKLKSLKKSFKNSLYDPLKTLLSMKAKEYNISSSLIATSDDIMKLSIGHHKKNKALQGWRKEVFGNDALKLIGDKV